MRSCHWAEGTTQGDPIALALCVLSIQPLVTTLQVTSTAKQYSSPMMQVGQALLQKSKDVGTLWVPGSRFWLLLKRQEVMDYRKAGQERKCERNTDISTTMEGKNHRRAAIGSREHQEKFFIEKVFGLDSEIVQLAEFLRYSKWHATPLSSLP